MLDIHRYLIKRTRNKKMIGLIKNGLLMSIANTSSHGKCVSLSNEKYDSVLLFIFILMNTVKN